MGERLGTIWNVMFEGGGVDKDVSVEEEEEEEEEEVGERLEEKDGLTGCCVSEGLDTPESVVEVISSPP